MPIGHILSFSMENVALIDCTDYTSCTNVEMYVKRIFCTLCASKHLQARKSFRENVSIYK